MLPAGLPTSVEANTGYIRYMARVVVDIPMAFDPEFEEIFTVIKAVNLNAIPALRVIDFPFVFISLIKDFFLFGYEDCVWCSCSFFSEFSFDLGTGNW